MHELELESGGGGGRGGREGSVWSKNKGGRAPPLDTPRSLGTATALIMGDKGEFFLFPSTQDNTDSILQKVTQLHKPKSLTISYCKQFFYLLLPTFGKPRKKEMQYVKTYHCYFHFACKKQQISRDVT